MFERIKILKENCVNCVIEGMQNIIGSVFSQKKINAFIYYLNVLFDISRKLKNQYDDDKDSTISKHQMINLCHARDMARDSKKPANKRIDIMIKLFFSALITSSIIFLFFENHLNCDAKTLLSSIIGFCYDMIKCIVIFEVGGGISTNFDDNAKKS
jgi:hypothetical protein